MRITYYEKTQSHLHYFMNYLPGVWDFYITEYSERVGTVLLTYQREEIELIDYQKGLIKLLKTITHSNSLHEYESLILPDNIINPFTYHATSISYEGNIRDVRDGFLSLYYQEGKNNIYEVDIKYQKFSKGQDTITTTTTGYNNLEPNYYANKISIRK